MWVIFAWNKPWSRLQKPKLQSNCSFFDKEFKVSNKEGVNNARYQASRSCFWKGNLRSYPPTVPDHYILSERSRWNGAGFFLQVDHWSDWWYSEFCKMAFRFVVSIGIEKRRTNDTGAVYNPVYEWVLCGRTWKRRSERQTDSCKVNKAKWWRPARWLVSLYLPFDMPTVRFRSLIVWSAKEFGAPFGEVLRLILCWSSCRTIRWFYEHKLQAWDRQPPDF